MIGHEQTVTVVSLSIIAFFYVVTIFFFLISERTRLNWSLAAQKTTWLAIILKIALPAYSQRPEYAASPQVRTLLFIALSIVTIWVLFEVYMVNRGRIKSRLRELCSAGWMRAVCGKPYTPWQPGDPARRSGYDRRRGATK
jgi:hypothetical protein